MDTVGEFPNGIRYVQNRTRSFKVALPILNFFQQGKVPEKKSWTEKLLQYYQKCQMDSKIRRLHLAFQKGVELALKELIAQ
ncbi:hypothetical protein LC612_38105 [Nostoc sp. CHAB 5834]|nr:hypothetical protein [Nostoc sp. CHAB 5834]